MCASNLMRMKRILPYSFNFEMVPKVQESVGQKLQSKFACKHENELVYVGSDVVELLINKRTEGVSNHFPLLDDIEVILCVFICFYLHLK